MTVLHTLSMYKAFVIKGCFLDMLSLGSLWIGFIIQDYLDGW